MNENEEYGVKLTIDTSEYLKGLQDIKRMTEEVATSIEKSKEKMQELPNPQQDVRDRIASGQIKITGVGEDVAEVEILTEEMKKLEQTSINMNQSMKQLNGESSLKAMRDDAEQTGSKFDYLKKLISDYATIIKYDLGQAFSGVAKDVSNVGDAIKNNVSVSIEEWKEKLRSAQSPINKVLTSIKNLGKQMTHTFTNGVKSLKRFGLSLLGVQGIFGSFRRAMNAYMSMDSDLQKSLQQTWAGLGSFLAPVLEYLIDAFKRLLAYINAVVTALTGINFVARANAKALDKQAKSAGNASKSLASFDEIKNLAQESGGGSANTIELPEVDASKLTGFFERLKQLFEDGDYYEIGRIISEKIAKGLDGIDWEIIKSKARLIAINTATLLNGFFENDEMWFQIGRTIGEGWNTVVTFLLNFVQTLNWRAIGSGIATSIMTAVRTINWTETWQLIADSIKGIADFLSGFFETMNFTEALTKIVDGLFKSDWSGAVSSISRLAGDLVAKLVELIILAPFEIGKKLGEKFVKSVDEGVDEYWDKGGTSIAGSILAGIKKPFEKIGIWLADNVFTPFIDGFKANFKIQGSGKSQVMVGLGNQITEGFHQGSSGIWNRVSGTFNTLKTNIVTVFNNIKTGVSNTMESLKSTMSTVWNGIWSIVKTVVNKIIGGVEQMCNTCIRGLNKLIKPLADVGNEVLKAIGIKKMSFSAIGEISLPRLSIGTDLVKEEGLAYLHAGEKVVPADVVKGGYSGEGNKETNELLRRLISIVDEKEFNVDIDSDSIGRASVNYIKNQSRIIGGSVI